MQRSYRPHALLTAFAGAALLFATACGGTTFAMAPDSSVPFAKGEVSAEIAKDGNGTYKVDVEHLGDPAKLNPSATTYVIWVQPKKEDSQIQNMGALKVDEAYNGSHTFSVTFKAFDITITPEADAGATKPTGRDILKASIEVD